MLFPKFINTKFFLFLFISISSAFILFEKYKPLIYTNFFEEGLPNFSNDYLLRTFFILLTTFIVLIGFIYKKQPESLFLNKKITKIEKYGTLFAISLSILFLLIFLFNTSLFNQLSLEDSLIESCSVFFLLASSFVFAYLAIKKSFALKLSKKIKWSFFLLSIGFFVIGMEEISWFQRVFDFETPATFSDNIQNEFNLHNFETDIVEHIYYFGAFVFLVVTPFIATIKPKLFNTNYLKLLTPRPYIIVIASIASSYNFEMWNSIITQTTFFLAVMILFALAYFSKKRVAKIIISFYIIVLIIQQVLFLNNPLNYDRGWEITEYKEFFIPLAFFVFSLDVFFRISKKVKTD